MPEFRRDRESDDLSATLVDTQLPLDQQQQLHHINNHFQPDTNALNGTVPNIPTAIHSQTISQSPISEADLSIESQNEVPTTYNAERVIGNGSFGIVYMAQALPSQKYVAIKKVFQDKRYRNRELQILQELQRSAENDIQHPNIVALINPFHTKGDRPDELFLNLVMEYVPDTLYNIARDLRMQNDNRVPEYHIMLFTYQLLRSLMHLRAHGIMHRDIKPQNLLVDDKKNFLLKLCDFGSAKKVQHNNESVQYICSRYYRAPELIFGLTSYDCAIDMWSAGCVMGELINNGAPIFPGINGVDQLVEIIKVLGSPSLSELCSISDKYLGLRYKPISARPLTDILPTHTRQKSYDIKPIKVLEKMLRINPAKRVHPVDALCNDYFEPLRRDKIHNLVLSSNMANGNQSLGCSSNSSGGSIVVPQGLQKFTKREIWVATNGGKDSEKIDILMGPLRRKRSP